MKKAGLADRNTMNAVPMMPAAPIANPIPPRTARIANLCNVLIEDGSPIFLPHFLRWRKNISVRFFLAGSEQCRIVTQVF